MGGLLIQSGANGHPVSLPTFGDLERRPAPVGMWHLGSVCSSQTMSL